MLRNKTANGRRKLDQAHTAVKAKSTTTLDEPIDDLDSSGLGVKKAKICTGLLVFYMKKSVSTKERKLKPIKFVAKKNSP